jgi:hypothetical protein
LTNLQNISDLVDSVIVSTVNSSIYTVEHEIAHVIANEPHYNDFAAATTQPNLLRNGTSTHSSIVLGNGVVDQASKRLRIGQQSRIYTQRPKIVVDYTPEN